MTKEEIVCKVARKSGIRKDVVRTVLNAVIDTIKSELVTGENVSLRDFCTFSIVRRKAKYGRDMVRDSMITIPAHMAVKIIPSLSMQESVKANLPVKD